MTDSQLFTLSPPFLTAVDNGATGVVPIAMAWKTPMRVVVRNISLGTIIYLAFNADALLTIQPPGSGLFQLPAGTSDVFVLAPNQRMFASASASGAQISIAISEAVPINVPK